MNKKEALLFNKLTEKRKTQWKTTLSDDDFKGTWDSIVEKYADSAHFVWELIQNADDAQASKVLFKVYEDKLIFIHNGKRHFSVTDCDSKTGVRGDINAIVSVARSNKKDSETIGKFGVGFKSVFEYTNAPDIYDDKFWFKIENYVVPKQLNADYPERKKGETVFVLKFKSPKQSVQAVKDKLSSLQNPVLFLKNVRRLEWEDKGETHFYCLGVRKNLLSERKIRCKYIQITKDDQKDDMLLFSRDVRVCGHCYEIFVGYYLENGWINTRIRPKIYCYFPTEESYGLCFISHAPFLTTDNRCSIKKKKENELFHEEVQKLAIDALPVIRDMGKEKGRVLVNRLIEHYAKFCEKSEFLWSIRDEKSKFLVAYFTDKLSGQKLLLTKNKEYTSGKNAVMAASGDLYKVLTEKQMRALFGSECSRGKLLSNYSADMRHYLQRNNLVKQFDWKDVASSLTADFVNKQGKKWVDSLYDILPENQLGEFVHSPIILMNDGSWISAFDENRIPNVFLPKSVGNSFRGMPLVDGDFCKKHNSTLQKLGVEEADYIGYLKGKLLPKYTNCNVTEGEALNDFKEIVLLYKAVEKEKRHEFLSEVKKKFIFRCVDGIYRKADGLYSPKEEIIAYFSSSQDYKPIIDAIYYERSPFLDVLEFQGMLRILSREFCEAVDSRGLFAKHKTEDMCNILSATDFYLDGYEHAFLSQETSQFIWRSIISDSNCMKKMHMDVCYKVYRGKSKKRDSQTIPSVLAKFLRNRKWVFLENNCPLTTSQITYNQFREYYDCNKQKELLKLIGLSEDSFQKVIEVAKDKNLSPERLIDLINMHGNEPEANALFVQAVETNDVLDSKTKPIINLLGRLLYEEYLKRMIKQGSYSVGSLDDVYDFSLAAFEYVDVATTTDSFKRGVPLHITIKQNEFLKTHPESQFKIVRISLRDLDLLKEYNEMKDIFKTNLSVEKNAGLRKYCECVVAGYWYSHSVSQFEDKIRSYQIKIERK